MIRNQVEVVNMGHNNAGRRVVPKNTNTTTGVRVAKEGLFRHYALYSEHTQRIFAGKLVVTDYCHLCTSQRLSVVVVDACMEL